MFTTVKKAVIFPTFALGGEFRERSTKGTDVL